MVFSYRDNSNYQPFYFARFSRKEKKNRDKIELIRQKKTTQILGKLNKLSGLKKQIKHALPWLQYASSKRKKKQKIQTKRKETVMIAVYLPDKTL